MTERGSNPVCNKTECFGCDDGHCIVLSKKITNKVCPFFKTREQVAEEKEYCRNRWQELEEENNYAE